LIKEQIADGGSLDRSTCQIQDLACIHTQRFYVCSAYTELVVPFIVCSAMGSTTNSLVEAGNTALGGKVLMESVRSLHHTACDELQVSFETRLEINELLAGVEELLSGVMLLGELSPRAKNLLVSYGERLSVRLVAAQLNFLGVPAKAFDAWDIGVEQRQTLGVLRLCRRATTKSKESWEKCLPKVSVRRVTQRTEKY
jgi:aspartate kinase